MKKIPFHLQLIRGAVGKKFVIKHYRKKIVMTRFPDMKNIKPSAGQRACRRSFADAVRYARETLNDPIRRNKLAGRIKKGTTVYHAAIREYMLLKEIRKGAGEKRFRLIKPAREFPVLQPAVPVTVIQRYFILGQNRLWYTDTG